MDEGDALKILGQNQNALLLFLVLVRTSLRFAVRKYEVAKQSDHINDK